MGEEWSGREEVEEKRERWPGGEGGRDGLGRNWGDGAASSATALQVVLRPAHGVEREGVGRATTISV